MAGAQPGVVGPVDVQTQSGGDMGTASPAFWTYFWVGFAALVILGFHIRVFGIPLPPAAHFPR